MEDPVPPPTTDKNSIENAQLSVDNNFVIESRELQHSVNSDENILQAEKSKSSETVQNVSKMLDNFGLNLYNFSLL